MKILHTVQSYLPERHGMSEVVSQISELLVKKGHQVVVATSIHSGRSEKKINGVEIKEFNISGNSVSGIQGESQQYTQLLKSKEFDIITNFAAQQWATDLALPILEQIQAKKVLVPTGFSALYNPNYQSYFENMKTWMGQYDRVVYLSDDYRDINFSRQNGLTNGIMIPNGAAEDEFLTSSQIDIRKILGIPSKHLFILHISGYVGNKGHLDAIRIFNQSGLKNATLVFVSPVFKSEFKESINISFARNMIKAFLYHQKISEMDSLRLERLYSRLNLCSRKIIFTSLPRPDIIAAYQNADLFLFPSHIECSPIVLFEAMASKTPFLATDVGNIKEIVHWGNSGVILPTLKEAGGNGTPNIDGSAELLRQLALDNDRRNEMAHAGFLAWQERFTWEKITSQYENLYLNLLSEKKC